jgi:hypothetical protein
MPADALGPAEIRQDAAERFLTDAICVAFAHKDVTRRADPRCRRRHHRIRLEPRDGWNGDSE